MITKVSTWRDEEDGPLIMEFPELAEINMNDHELQKYLIKYGVAVGLPGTTLHFTQAVQLRAGKVA